MLLYRFSHINQTPKKSKTRFSTCIAKKNNITGKSQICFHTSMQKHPQNSNLKYNVVSSSLLKLFFIQFSSSDLALNEAKSLFSNADFCFVFVKGNVDIVRVLNNIFARLGELCIVSVSVQLPVLVTVLGVTGDGVSFSGVKSGSLTVG